MRHAVTSLPPWLARPLGLLPTIAVGAILCAAPAYLLRDALWHHVPAGEDFVVLAASRTVTGEFAPVGTPPVGPWFRAWTYLLGRFAGDLADLPGVLTIGALVPFVLVVFAVGHVVAHEWKRMAPGFAAMAVLGCSTVLEPAATHFAASAALWAGFGTLAMLAALQEWRATGRVRWMALACLAVLLAAWSAPAGYVAGPAGFVYLWADGRPRCKKAAAIPLVVGLACAGVAIGMGGWTPSRAAHPLVAVLDTFRAIPEALVLGNLGLDAAVDPAQGAVFVVAIVALWAWTRLGSERGTGTSKTRSQSPSRPRPPWPSPLEAAGATMVVVGFLLAFTFTFQPGPPFDGLDPIRVDPTIPQVGAVLFVAGWWAGPAGEWPGWPRPLSRGAAPAVLGLAVLLIALHGPRAERLVLDEAPEVTPAEMRGFIETFRTQGSLDPEGTLPPELLKARAIVLADDRREAQRLFLARLDRAERIASARGFDRASIRRAFGRVLGPGLPADLPDFDAVDLLNLPDSGQPADPAAVHAALGNLLISTPEPRPPWLPKGEPWPPK
ncbi:MAG TPA: hypothetical protein VG406_12105 [Isosphaeraceae bacterium]|nr:hypothetical protein [Isosphaeraceae bacterium]